MIGTTGSKWETREKSRASAKRASVGRVYREVSFNDGLYLCNPLDLTRYLRGLRCEVLRDVALGRSGWTRMLAGGTWVSVRTPSGAGLEAIDPTGERS